MRFRHCVCMLMIMCLGLCMGVSAKDNVKIMPVDPAIGIFSTPQVCTEFTQGPAGKLSSHAQISTIDALGGKVHIAVDKIKRSQLFNVVALDLSGTGEFQKPVAVDLRRFTASPDSYYGRFGPKVLSVEKGSYTIKFVVLGFYQHFPQRGVMKRRLEIKIGVMLQGTCKCGRRTVKVALVDGNQNLQFGDKSSFSGSKLTIGDTLVVATGSFTSSKGVSKVFFGQPICVEDKWYNIKFQKSPMSFTAEPVEVETGTLSIKHYDWTAVFVQDDNKVVGMAGGPKPVPMPTGSYKTYRFEERYRGATLQCGGTKSESFTLAAGDEKQLEIGSPIQGKPVVSQSGRNLKITAKLLEASGMEVSAFEIGQGNRPPPPRILILDENGQKLYEANLSYG